MGILDGITGLLGKVGGAVGLVIVKLPQIIEAVETIFGSGNGAVKQESVVALVSAILSTAEGVSSKDIVDNDAFQAGLRKAIDGTVEMLNASIWYKKTPPDES